MRVHSEPSTANVERIRSPPADKPDPLNPDTDGDKLLDGNDITDTPTPCANAKFVALLIICKAGKWLGELTQNGDRKKVDKDGDGLPDGWEARFGSSAVALSGSGDEDDDELINTQEFELGTVPGPAGPGASDTDADGLPDGWETSSGLAPLHTATRRYFLKADWTLAYILETDADEGGTGNPDKDGAGNLAEYNAGTSPTAADTDGDGLVDGASVTNVPPSDDRFKLWTSQGISYSGTGATVTFFGETAKETDPLKLDTDGDAVLDGQEVYGYTVTIMWYEGDDLKSRDVVVNGCPKASGAYKATDCTTLLDVDGDGIADWDEFDPRNANAAQGVKDFVATYGSNETMMENQFNAFLRENVAPILVHATAQSDVEWGWCWFVPCVKRAWTTVYVETLDVASQTVKVTAGWLMRSKSADLPAGKAAMTVEVDIDFWFDYLVRFDVRIDLADESGNVMDPPYRTQVEGLFAGVLKFLEWLAEGIASIVAAIAKALSFIVDLIISGLRAAVDAILGPIVQALNSWTNGVISVIQRVFEKHSPSMADLDPTLAASLIHDAIVSPEFYMIVAMCVAVAVIITIVSYILLPFGFIISASLPTS